MIANWVRMPGVTSALIIGSLWPSQAAHADDGVIYVPCTGTQGGGILGTPGDGGYSSWPATAPTW